MKLLLCIFFLSLLSCTSKSQVVLEEQETAEVVMPSYEDIKQGTLEKRDAFRVRYQTEKNKDSVLVEAQKYLLAVSDDYFRSWYGTPWTFHGHSRIPKEGSIACGYFVTTTLQDMGFNIPRIKWAQQTSEYLVKKVSTDIKRFYKKPMQEIVDYIASKGNGLYIVGLDSHVGYIYCMDGKMSFVHANYYRPNIGVMSESLIGRNPLNDSKYKVIGRIFDKEMVKNWILNTSYAE